MRSAGHEANLVLERNEEASRKLDADAAASRARIAQLEGALKVMHTPHALSPRAARQHAWQLGLLLSRWQHAPTGSARCSHTLFFLADRALLPAHARRGRFWYQWSSMVAPPPGGMPRCLQAKEKEVEKVMRVLQQQRSSEYEGVAQRLAAEEVARKLDEEAALVG